ncbi:MAG: T9SS type A sorting domain-containing protein, partial [Ignavibacteriaceae bacterium]|nr:T9SS type A sorting domain-containing protein [Ignavibacteriaceae bacterium]
TILFSLPQSGNVNLTLYNLLGEQVAELVNGFREAGIHTINFSAKGGSAFGGNAYALPSGLYIYRLEANGFVQSRKMTLIK